MTRANSENSVSAQRSTTARSTSKDGSINSKSTPYWDSRATKSDNVFCQIAGEEENVLPGQSIALQELASLLRGKGQGTPRRLASRAYYSNDYASQEKAALYAFQAAVGEELQLKCAKRGCKTLEMAMETVKIQERYTRRAVRAFRTEEFEVTKHLKAMGERLEALLSEIRDDRKQRKQWPAQ